MAEKKYVEDRESWLEKEFKDMGMTRKKQVQLRDSEYCQVPGRWEWLETKYVDVRASSLTKRDQGNISASEETCKPYRIPS